MPTLTLKDTEVKVPTALVVRMADRLHRLGTARRKGCVERARTRLDAGGKHRNDAAAVLTAAPAKA